MLTSPLNAHDGSQDFRRSGEEDQRPRGRERGEISDGSEGVLNDFRRIEPMIVEYQQ